MFVKNSFSAYEIFEPVFFVPEDECNGIYTLKINGVSKGKMKQIQINLTKNDYTEFKQLKKFVEDVDKSMVRK